MPVKQGFQLPSGDIFPSVGFGTWTVWSAEKGVIHKAVKEAITVGYRHIDCAYVYQNQDEVGQAIKDKIEDGTVKREDLFIVTKVWNTAHRRGAVKEQLQKSLKQLELTYVDLYLVHYPISFKEGDDIFPKDDDGNLIFEHYDIVDTWKGMEDCVDSDLARNIGISNFNHLQIGRIIDAARIQPCVIQLEVNPTIANTKLVDFCKQKNIVVTAYAPLGNPNRSWKESKDPTILADPVLNEIALSKGKSVAQVVLRFLLQRDLVVIPKSANADRIKENFQLFNFELNEAEMKKIWSLDKNFRVYTKPIAVDHPEYPFHIEY
ncbi:hypothetical protein LOTGIDRAFT_207435 [Lottia gigantea]|uniref:NADP-dependent oxidoreductase domain-containing protein n=1 Tax=Lottia gigantea TaxID=225164 RepID=V3ZE99_LOTGI|nr:hypothetical protein LOTGIDRAFT_207435 [Lottia gigantea]ESO82377.1 hypothetical protein LOTGIDRAFT_207435 [Lottia gigantea]